MHFQSCAGASGKRRFGGYDDRFHDCSYCQFSQNWRSARDDIAAGCIFLAGTMAKSESHFKEARSNGFHSFALVLYSRLRLLQRRPSRQRRRRRQRKPRNSHRNLQCYRHRGFRSGHAQRSGKPDRHSLSLHSIVISSTSLDRNRGCCQSHRYHEKDRGKSWSGRCPSIRGGRFCDRLFRHHVGSVPLDCRSDRRLFAWWAVHEMRKQNLKERANVTTKPEEEMQG